MEEYLLDAGWTFNPETRLWTAEGQNDFTLMDAFSVQSYNDFGSQYPN